MSTEYAPDPRPSDAEDDYCSLCNREVGESHTENCPLRGDQGGYVLADRFTENVKAIGDSLDRRDATIAALTDALEAAWPIIFAFAGREVRADACGWRTREEVAQSKALLNKVDAALAKVRGGRP